MLLGVYKSVIIILVSPAFTPTATALVLISAFLDHVPQAHFNLHPAWWYLADPGRRDLQEY